MIKVTPDAVEQIRLSAKQSGIAQPILRIAVKEQSDGSLHYAMGFDDAISDKDHRFQVEGIEMVISELSEPLARDMTIDFVELDNGEKNFIFINPQDKNYSPPEE